MSKPPLPKIISASEAGKCDKVGGREQLGLLSPHTGEAHLVLLWEFLMSTPGENQDLYLFHINLALFYQASPVGAYVLTALLSPVFAAALSQRSPVLPRLLSAVQGKVSEAVKVIFSGSHRAVTVG